MTTKIETLTDVERHQLPLYTPYLGSKAIRIIDAHAAERAALTEQVAQLTEVVAFLRRQNKADHDALSALRRSAEGKVLRLTEALAAAEKKQSDTERWRGWERDRAEAAERDRDAANALLRAAQTAGFRFQANDAVKCALEVPCVSDYVTVEWDNGREGVAIAVDRLRALLAAQGLHVVTTADKAVLDAAAALHPRSLRRPLQYVGDWEEFVDAELARRGSAK